MTLLDVKNCILKYGGKLLDSGTDTYYVFNRYKRIDYEVFLIGDSDCGSNIKICCDYETNDKIAQNITFSGILLSYSPTGKTYIKHQDYEIMLNHINEDNLIKWINLQNLYIKQYKILVAKEKIKEDF